MATLVNNSGNSITYTWGSNNSTLTLSPGGNLFGAGLLTQLTRVVADYLAASINAAGIRAFEVSRTAPVTVSGSSIVVYDVGPGYGSGNGSGYLQQLWTVLQPLLAHGDSVV